MRRHRGFVALAGALLVAVPIAGRQATKIGNPEDHLPPGISRLTSFGERAAWSPDGRRIAFMSRSFGDAFEIDLATHAERLLTHYPHAGFLRVHYLPNGHYLLIGARTFTDIQTTRGRDEELWILPRDFRPGDHAIPLEQKISEGVAVSRRSMTIAWSNTHGQYPDRIAEGESILYTGRVVEEGGAPHVVDVREVMRARAPECTLEAQDFRRDDQELVYTCYRGQFADIFGVDLASGRVTTYLKIAGEYNEVEGILPDGVHTLVESSREQSNQDASHIDIWKLRLVAGSSDFVRLTHWGEYDGYKASNPVVSPDGGTMAFQSARSKDAAGVGYGIFLYRLQGRR